MRHAQNGMYAYMVHVALKEAAAQIFNLHATKREDKEQGR